MVSGLFQNISFTLDVLVHLDLRYSVYNIPEYNIPEYNISE
jgi:hypothetical protein